ncbi:unnamed protein product [Leptosia nina]|uniref:C2H2-type domain-containing protein n=1 Tax=Leptosia nina TaxID=320188 RepID=A0AAV1K169_9NEOP
MYERLNAATLLQHTTAKPFLYKAPDYKCFYCLKTFYTVASVLEHTDEHPAPDRPKLLKSIKGTSGVKVDISNLRCRLCGDPYSDLVDIKSHLIEIHGKEFYNANNGLVPYDLKEKNGVLSCYKCKKTFNSFFILNTHMNEHSTVVCETCGLGFMSKQRLLNHMIVHQTGAFKCRVCDEVFPTKLKLRYHANRKHDFSEKRIKRLKCPHCLERFSEHYRKMTHLKEVHSIVFAFDCQICEARLPTRKALTQHTTKLHTLSIQCKICNKCFGNNSVLKLHMMSHTGERSFVCSICQKAYKQKKSLKKHMTAHGPVAQGFTCDKCGSGFLNRNDYNAHVKEC